MFCHDDSNVARREPSRGLRGPFLTEEDKPDEAHLFEPLRLLPRRPQCHPSRLLDRVAEDPGRDGGESDGLQAVLLGETEGVTVAAGKKFCLGPVLAVDWSQRVDDVPVREPVRAGDNSRAWLYGAERHGFFGKVRPGGPVDGACHAAAWSEPRVRRVDHGLDVFLGRYISPDTLDRYGTELSSHTPSQDYACSPDNQMACTERSGARIVTSAS